MSRRSKWKGVFVDNVFLKKFLVVYDPDYQKIEDEAARKIDYKGNLRNTTIINSFVGYEFSVHRGQVFDSIVVSSSMVGFKFGDFAVVDRVRKFVDIKTSAQRKLMKVWRTIQKIRAKSIKRYLKRLAKDD